jgi:hypothetical protein
MMTVAMEVAVPVEVPVTMEVAPAHLLDHQLRTARRLRALSSRERSRDGEFRSERRTRQDRRTNGESFETHLGLSSSIHPGPAS